MNIRVLMFATLAKQTGVKEAQLNLPASATVDSAVDAIARAHPAVAALRNRVATAVNLAYVPANHALQDGDELALIPPVSGG